MVFCLAHVTRILDSWPFLHLRNFIIVMNKAFFSLKLNLLGWHWLVDPYRFQLYISMLHDLYIALCAHRQSQIIFCHHIFGPLKTFWMGKGNKQAVGSRGNTAYKQLIEECEISSVFKEIFLKQNEIHFLPISTFLKIIICNTG